MAMKYAAPAVPHVVYEVYIYRDHVMVHRRNELWGNHQSVMLDGQAAEALHTDLLRIELNNAEPHDSQTLGAKRLAGLF